MGSILYALEVPPYGGDTLLTNMYFAYERLSGGRGLLDTLFAAHSDRTMSDPEARDTKNETRSSKLNNRDVGETRNEHRVVRTHPETGRKALFVNSIFTVGFKGVTADESRLLLQFLFEQAQRPEVTCRFRWQNNSLAMSPISAPSISRSAIFRDIGASCTASRSTATGRTDPLGPDRLRHLSSAAARSAGPG